MLGASFQFFGPDNALDLLAIVFVIAARYFWPRS